MELEVWVVSGIPPLSLQKVSFLCAPVLAPLYFIQVKGPPPPSLLPLGSSACLASLRRAAAKLEEGADWTDKVLLAAGLPLGTREALRGDGVRGLTVAVVRVAVESIPREGDFGSWLMPETMKRRIDVTGREGVKSHHPRESQTWHWNITSRAGTGPDKGDGLEYRGEVTIMATPEHSASTY